VIFVNFITFFHYFFGQSSHRLIKFDNKSTALGSKMASKKVVDAGVIAVIGPASPNYNVVLQ